MFSGFFVVLAVFLFIFMQILCIFILFCDRFYELKQTLVDVFAGDEVVFDSFAGDETVAGRDGLAVDEAVAAFAVSLTAEDVALIDEFYLPHKVMGALAP